jgi:hypothetical protein
MDKDAPAPPDSPAPVKTNLSGKPKRSANFRGALTSRRATGFTDRGSFWRDAKTGTRAGARARADADAGRDSMRPAQTGEAFASSGGGTPPLVGLLALEPEVI